MGIFGFFNKSKKETLDKGLEKTKQSVFSKLTRAVAGKSKVDDEVLDDLEEILITSDVGVDTTLKIIERIEARVARDKYVSTSELNNILKEEITALLSENNTQDNDNWDLPQTGNPYVILVVGVNGVGKTTTIGKLAHQFKQAGKKVYLGAADTFRAAAVEQICIWGERVGVPVVKQQMGSDPASVAFDTLSSAKANDERVEENKGSDEKGAARSTQRSAIGTRWFNGAKRFRTSQAVLSRYQHHGTCYHQTRRHSQRGRSDWY